MQYVLRYSLKPGSAVEHQNWLADHERTNRQDTGWSYVGTWFNLKGAEGYASPYDYETRWELDAQPAETAHPFAAETQRHMSPQLSFIEQGSSFFLGTVTPVYGREN